MKAFTKSLFLVFIIFSIVGCSRKKDTFINRNWHAITAEYNTLYNGNLALQLGREEINQNYQDDYWNILPVERMQVSEEILPPGESKNPNFQIAEQKAVKAIQRHSMLIDGREKNPQIDEAYLLLGKARYYDQRFIPALEAFNYILHKYPLSNTIDHARIWREKANIRLEFEELAIKNLKKILEQEVLKDQDRADASAMLAEAYINLSQIDSAVAPIKTAAAFTGNNNEKGRYLFIKGQLYDRLGMKDSANMAFEEVIDLKRKSSRIYLVNAQIARAQNLAAGSEDKAAILELLTEMERNRENRPFLDKIYFQLAEFHYNADSLELAVDYYNKSLRTPSEDSYLQSLDYQTLGNIHFDAANYETAGAYYDSTLLRLPENSREFRLIKKKRDNLEDVITYEGIARETDSILYVSDLSETERLDYFTAYTNQLKEDAKQEIQETAISSSEERAQNFFEDKRVSVPGVPNPGNSFYFYNSTAVAYGKQEFFRVWGDRDLTDNWRTGGDGSFEEKDNQIAISEAAIEADPLYDPKTYIRQIPTDPEVLDSLQKERNFAWYQLGLIYREKFGDDQLAAKNLELLLDGNPEERLILPAKYHLYKIYSEAGNLARAQALKVDILEQYPESRYAAILENPEAVLQDENSPQVLYNELYGLFEDQEFQEVISRINELSGRFSGDVIEPKLELLKAMAIGRLHGFEAYKEALNFVALNFPQSEEGKKAQQLHSEAIPALAEKQFQHDSIAKSFKLVFSFEGIENEEKLSFITELEKILEELNYDYLEVSLDVYNPLRDFVVLHGFSSRGRAEGFGKMLSENEDYQIDKNYFYISTPNYRIIQIHKNVDSYLESLTNTPQ